MSADTPEWAWADASGQVFPSSRAELVRQLKSGEVEPDVHVWKRGWVRWLRVTQVAELAGALPLDQTERAVLPEVDSSIQQPPPLPGKSATAERTSGTGYEPYKRRESSTFPTLTDEADYAATPTLRPPAAVPPPPRRYPSGRPQAQSSRARNVGGPASAPRVGAEDRSSRQPQHPQTDDSVQNRPPLVRRPAAPTIPDTEEGFIIPQEAFSSAATAKRSETTSMKAFPTKRHVPPPPVTPPPETRPPAAPKRSAAPDNEALPSGSVDASSPGAGSAPVASQPDGAFPDTSGLAGSPAFGSPASEATARADLRTDTAFSSAAPAATPDANSDHEKLELAVLVLAVLTGIFAVAALVLIFSPAAPHIENGMAVRQVDSPPAAQGESAEAQAIEPRAVPPATSAADKADNVPAETPRQPLACQVTKPPTRIAASILMGVPPYVRGLDNGRLAVGIAATQTQALGLIVDPATSDVSRAFEKQDQRPILGVVPVKQPGGELRFAVDRQGGPLRYARSLDTEPLVTLGVADGGFAQWTRGQHPRLVWTGHGREKITEPRVAHVDDVGYAVTFRRGGQSGKVLIGWIGADGRAQTPLTPLEPAAQFVGTPTIAANSSHILVSFAARDDAETPWQMMYALAKHSELPEHVATYRPPGSDRANTVIAPAVAGLADDQWLLQWTEAFEGSYRVRVVAADSKLSPVGEPFTTSPEGKKAGQGVVWASADTDHATSLYIVTNDANPELWATGLQCGAAGR